MPRTAKVDKNLTPEAPLKPAHLSEITARKSEWIADELAASRIHAAPGIVSDLMAGEENEVLNITEAAAILRVHPVTLRKRAVAWGVPHKRLGSEWRFSRSVLTAWIQERGVV